MHRFLKVPHWMIFGFCFGLPLIIELIIAFNTQIAISRKQAFEDDSTEAFLIDYAQELENLIYATPILFISLCLYLGYFWSVGVSFQRKIEEGFKRSYLIFSILLIVMIGLFLYQSSVKMQFFSTWNLNKSIGWGNHYFYDKIRQINYIMILVITYLSYYAAKTYKTVEQQQKVKFRQFILEFFLFLFLPIGIWLLQPKINQLYLQDKVKE